MIGRSLGPYRVLGKLGEGGMGEVYRARDDRLDRDVAIKILPQEVAGDPDRLERFEREARASAALDHPNIVSTHDIGRADNVTYVVMELIDGATLRDELARRPPTPRKALDWAVDVARGLAAAHAKGIIHRDIKPENLLVTADGRIKILDFGIARFAAPESRAGEGPTVAAGTEPGKVLGTAGYMSPEQVRGETIDARSDIFSLGAVLYEMLAGARAFQGDTAVETMHAVLKADPPEFSGAVAIPPALDRIVRRCLEKRPEDRFHSAHDLALALDAVSGARTQPTAAVAGAGPPRRGLGLTAVAGLLVLAMAAAAAAATWWTGGRAEPVLPEIRQITVRRGTIDAARFTTAGDSVVYSARFAGAVPAPFETHLNSPEARQVGPDNALLFSASGGALALGLEPRLNTGRFIGTLAIQPPGASAARELAKNILAADFAGDGLAAAEFVGNSARVHLPIGTVVHESRSRVTDLRVAPDGRTLAFIEGNGLLRLPPGGTAERVARGATGLAWSPTGDRLWYSSETGLGQSAIWSVAPGEAPIEEWRTAGLAVLDDIAADGRVLIRRTESHAGTVVVRPGVEAPEDLSWLDQTQAVAISESAGTLLLNDAAGFYVRRLDGSPALHLGEGFAGALSSDGQQVLHMLDARRFVVSPVGPGTPRELAHPEVESYFPWFHPDGRRIVFNGRVAGGTWRHFVMNLDGSGDVTPVGPDNLEHWAGQVPVSNDGRWLLGFPLPARVVQVHAIDGSESIDVNGMRPDEVVIRFADGDREIFVYNRDGLPARVHRLNYRTGERRLWYEFRPGDPAGIFGIPSIAMTADGRIIAFNYIRTLSTLYEVSGLGQR